MCGIGGISLKPKVKLNIQPLLERIIKIQHHRGPDGHGIWLSSHSTIGLCHNRLAILDLTPAGAQPMRSADGTLVVVFNGEIYNFKELRAQLKLMGEVFRSESDTEVLLAAYRQWGQEMVHHLRGMFAFALYDAKNDLLFCARDHVGKKPFVYTETPVGFTFGSEIPAVLTIPDCNRSINTNALAGMLLHNIRHITDPNTAYQGVKRLRAGHAMVVRGGVIIKIWQYWVPKPDTGEITASRLYEKLDEAVKLRMVADVPVGALLSGGVDSSAIVALMARHSSDPIRTYALGLDCNDEDLRRARIMADRLGCRHREFYFDAKKQWDVFCKLILAYGEPIMLLPLIHAYELCESIREDGVKVVLGGHGADELFYGYTGHVHTARISAMIGFISPVVRMMGDRVKSRSSLQFAMLSVPPGGRKAAFYRHCEARDWTRVIHPDARATLTNVVAEELSYWGHACPSKNFIDESNFCALMVENTHSVTISADLPPMLSSVEMRAPFLDQSIVNFALGTPARKKVPWIAPMNRLKWILRKAVRGLVPHELLFAPKRGFGFGIPQDDVLRGPWAHHGDDLFANPHDADGLFDVNSLRAIWLEYKLHGSAGSNVVPNLFAIQYWLQSGRVAK